MAVVDELIVVPLGGFTGAGMGGHVRSEGRVDVATLSAADKAAVAALFDHHPAGPANFQYQVTRQSPEGSKTVTVPADRMPQALTSSIRTTLD